MADSLDRVGVEVVARTDSFDEGTKRAAQNANKAFDQIRISAKEFQTQLKQAGGDADKALAQIANSFQTAQKATTDSIQKMVAGDLGIKQIAPNLHAVVPAAASAGAALDGLAKKGAAAGAQAAVTGERLISVANTVASGNVDAMAAGFGHVVLKLAEISTAATLAALGLGAVAAVTAYVGVRSFAAREQMEAIQNTMSQIGRGAQFSEAKVKQLVDRLADDMVTAKSSVRETIATIEQIPQATAATREALVKISLAIAKATGREPVDVAKEFVQTFSSGATALVDFANKTNLLNSALTLEAEKAARINDLLKTQDIVIKELLKRYQPWIYWLYNLSSVVDKTGMSVLRFMEIFKSSDKRWTTPPALAPGPPSGEGKPSDAARALDMTRSVTSDLERRQAILSQLSVIQRALTTATAEEAAILKSRAAKMREELAAMGKGAAAVAKSTMEDELAQAGRDIERRVEIIKKYYEREKAMRGANSAEAIQMHARLVQEQDRADEFRAAKEKLRADMRRDEAQTDIQIEEQRVQQLSQLGLMSVENEVARMRELNRRKLEADEEYFTKLKLFRRDDALYQMELDAQLARSKQQWRVRENQLNIQSQSTMANAYKAVWGSFESSVQGAANALLSGQQTAAQAGLNILTSVGGAMVNQLIHLGLEWLTTQLGIEALLGLTSKVTAAGRITNEAAVAAAAAYASTAAIPIVGPVLAPGAAATAYAGSLSWIGALALPTAAKGWDVDRDSMAYIHKKEMVLPADIAEGVRGMVEGGQGFGGSMINNWRIERGDLSEAAVLAILQRATRNFSRKMARAR